MVTKIPTGIRDGYWASFDTEDLTTDAGRRLVELIDARLSAFATRYADLYPAAMKILLIDRQGLTAYLRSRPNIITASATPTSSNATSAKPAAAQRLSAASTARPAA